MKESPYTPSSGEATKFTKLMLDLSKNSTALVDAYLGEKVCSFPPPLPLFDTTETPYKSP